MKYYVVIGHKKGESIDGPFGKNYDCDWIEMIERDDEYSANDFPPGAHQLFGYLDINFNESVQYGSRATKTQEAWLIGRHRIARMLDFGNFGYQFVRSSDTKRIQFPDKITLSFDKKIKDNGVNKPNNDAQRVDIELTNLNEQIINCYDKECDIDPVVFKLAKFDNYGDAYIDLQEIDNLQDFKLHIDHFVHFMRNYPNSNVFLVCKNVNEADIKALLRDKIKNQNLTNYFEFCDPNFERRRPNWGAQSGTPNSEYDTFSETIEQFFNENVLNQNKEKNFFNVPFKQAKITINGNWFVYANSEKFIKFLHHNPNITLEISGDADPKNVALFIRQNSIKANIILPHLPNIREIEEAIAHNRNEEIQKVISQHGYDELESPSVEEEENKEYRLTLEKYLPQKLNLANVQVQNADMQVGQNQNQNQNQNQAQQLHQSNNAPYEPTKLEINNKSSIPDVNFAIQEKLLKSLIGLPFASNDNAPQTETNIDHLFAAMEKIIQDSPASEHCYCPLSYSVEELVPGAFYVPKDKISSIPHPGRFSSVAFNQNKNTLFFSPPYASIAIKKDKYAFKPYQRPTDATDLPASGLVKDIIQDKYIRELIGEYKESQQQQKIILLFNKLFSKRGQAGVDLLTRSLYSLKSKNPSVYQSLIKHYLLTSNDFREYVDGIRSISTFEALGKLKDKKQIDWWNKLVKIQCRNNPHFDLNHLFAQFTSFWEDMDKLQKFIPIPEQFPFDDFADAGITLGKMYRIMSKARNRFEQIKSFAGGNISHAYMLFDLFNTSLYCKEMDEYCVILTKQLKAEDAFDKSKLKKNHFSTKKLAELTHDPDVSLEQLKSYLFIFAAVNGNTQKHNNSDLAFYNSLFRAIEEAIRDKHYSASEKKEFYSAVMLFASYGNNTTKERMVEDIKAFANHKDPVTCCKDIWDIYKDQSVSNFFSAQEQNGKMTNSEAMPSFHTIATLCQKTPDYKKIIQQSTDLIVENKALSPALQKIMRDVPDCFMRLADKPPYLANPYNEQAQLIQSIFLMVVALNEHYGMLCSQDDYNQLRMRVYSLDITRLTYLNQLFLDIDVAKFPADSLFTGKNLSFEFCTKALMAQNLDDLIFVLQDYHVQLTTIKPSEQGLLLRVKQLENNLANEANKKHYVTNYQDLVIKRLRSILEPQLVDFFAQQFVRKIDSSFQPQVLKASYESLLQIIETTKKDNLLEVIPVLEQFPIGNTQQSIDPAQLLNVTAVLLKHASPVESIVTFLESIKDNAPHNANAKLLYLQNIFGKILKEPTCYENNNPKNNLNKGTITQIKACMQLMKTIDTVDTSALDSLFANSRSLFAPSITIPLYLQFLEVLASPTNLCNDFVKNNFTKINRTLLDVLLQHPNSFSDLLDIARFDVELLSRLSFHNRNELGLIARICKNEYSLNSRKSEQPASDYKKQFAQNIKTLLDKKLDLEQFYSEKQLSQPSVDVLVQLLSHYDDNVAKAHHHYEKDPWFNRPHKKKDLFGKNKVGYKDLAYQLGQFDMVKQKDVLDQITSKDLGLEKSIRRNLLFTLSTYINEVGFRLPAFKHTAAGKTVNVPVRKLSDIELKAAFEQVKQDLAHLRNKGQTNIWQNKKYQRSVCKLLAIIREAVYRDGDKNAYSTQMDAILLAVLAGDYQYAMQINTGEGKLTIAAAIAIALQTISDKQIIVTTSNLSLADRDFGVYNKLIQWFGITHESISATTKDKNKLLAKIIHTTGNDFALCHGKDVLINNHNKIYLNDEYDYTMSHLTPSINSQSKPNEEESWWIYEEIGAYVAGMDEKEAKRKPEQQALGLIRELTRQFDAKVLKIQEELARKLFLVDQNADNKSPEEQLAAREAIEKECNERIEFFAKRIAKLNQPETEDQFNTLIDSAIIAQFVLSKGVAYEVIDQIEDGKTLKKVVPTEGGKPITEGDVMYMYGIHQFLIQKTILEYKEAGDHSEFIKPSALESTTYFNNYSTQAGSKSIGITGTVPKEKYKMYDALIGGGKSDVIPPHKVSQRVDAVPYENFKDIKVGSEHVCRTEEQLIKQLVQKIKEHDGPALLYCSNKNVCEARRDALVKQLDGLGYTVQIIIPGVTENFTDGEKLTNSGRQAQQQKTVTLTVGDGRGIDIQPKGKDGLLPICTFVPETLEKILQIYGRSGRNGQFGKTNLFILESELTKYGVTFSNLEEEFKFLDEIRYKEFDFAIKKVGFMQYEIQKQIGDAQQKITMIAYMDDLYNKLLLKAVADKFKNRKGNQIGSHKISGRWEPFVMLNDEELMSIYHEFCNSCKDKLQEMRLYNIDIENIKNLQSQYRQQAKQAIKQEKAAQQGLDKESVLDKIEQHTKKQERKLWSILDTVELSDGTCVDISNRNTRSTYNQFAMNIGRYDKTVSMMQKFVGTHLGIYGFINESTFVPYEQVYGILEEQTKLIKDAKGKEKEAFYEYLIYAESLDAINLLLEDFYYGSKRNQAEVESHFKNAERYNNMTLITKQLGSNTVSQIREKVLSYYGIGRAFSPSDIDLFKGLEKQLERDIEQNRKAIATRKETIINQCQITYQELQDKINAQGIKPISELASRPMKENTELADLFSMLQMATKEERNAAPIKKIISDISKKVSPTVDKYNEKVQKYKAIIKKQRACLEDLKQPHDSRDKFNKYEEMVDFDDVASKDMVAFYHDYNEAPGKIISLSEDIKAEQLYLNELEAEIERRRLEAEAERRRLADEAERRRLQEEAERRRLQEEAERRRAQEDAERRRMHYLNAVQQKITTALRVLKGRIEEIEHPLADALTVANTLFDTLDKEQNTYLINLGQALNQLDLTVTDFNNVPRINELNSAYVQTCEGLINNVETRAVLERDLHWGPFLNNLLKMFVNIIILGVTFGQVNNFFPLAKAETMRLIDESKSELTP